jgi:hypothetical protein
LFLCLVKVGLCFVTEWQNNPVLITLETTDLPVEEIPFPAITICPEKNEPSCFEIIAKILDYVEFPIFEDRPVLIYYKNFSLRVFFQVLKQS